MSILNKNIKTISFINIFIYILMFCGTTKSFSQSDWVNYLVEKDKGLMSIYLDLNLNFNKPSYKYLLIVGIDFKKNCHKNGFPKNEGLNKLYSFSDSIALTIKNTTKYKLASIITYKCFGFDIYYVKDTMNIRSNINKLIDKNFKNSDNYIILEKDKKWQYYYNIFPENKPNDFFVNHQYLIEMVSRGDDLTEKRKVNHWVSFKKEKKRLKYINKLKPFGFSIDSLNFRKKNYYPFELQISRIESVEPNSIDNLTEMLKILARSFYGQYDGWGTESIIPD